MSDASLAVTLRPTSTLSGVTHERPEPLPACRPRRLCGGAHGRTQRCHALRTANARAKMVSPKGVTDRISEEGQLLSSRQA